MKFLPQVAVITTLAVLLAGCSTASKTTPTPEASPVSEVMTEPVASASPEAMMEKTDGEVAYDVEMSSFSFSEKTMQAKAGEAIKVKLTNTEGFHDFVIDELNVASSKLAEGKSEVIEITVPAGTKTGTTYEYYCSVGNHRQQGMVGTLTVK